MAFSYNELNQLSKINDWLGTTTIENDIRGRQFIEPGTINSNGC